MLTDKMLKQFSELGVHREDEGYNNFELPDDFTRMPLQDIRKQLPVKFRKRLRDEPLRGSRSDQVFAFIQDMKDASVPRTLALNALLNYPPAVAKYGERIEQEVVRAYSKPGNGASAEEEDDEYVEPEYILDDLGDLDAENVDWLWDGYIPMNNLTIVAGRQGLGKSQWTAWLASQVSRGIICDPGAVMFVSLEDSVTHTISPRLRAAKADLQRVKVFRGVKRDPEDEFLSSINLMKDSPYIARLAKKLGIKLLIIDPLSAILSDGSRNYDSHRESDVRRALLPLTRAAEEGNFAVVAVMHLKKQRDVDDPMNSIIGSIANTAAARSVLMFMTPGKDSNASDADRMLVQVKSNLGELQMSRHLRIQHAVLTHGHERVKTSIIRDLGTTWEGVDDVELVQKSSSRLEEACLFLVDALQGGTTPAREVQMDAALQGISEITLRRARKRLGVMVQRPQGPKTRAMWSLPEGGGSS